MEGQGTATRKQKDYNEVRLHSSLDDRTPGEFARRNAQMFNSRGLAP